MEGPGPLRVAVAGGPSLTLAARGPELRAGGRDVGRSHRIAGDLMQVEGRFYRGALEAQRVPGGIRLVNHVPLEAYVVGTLGREIYPSWEPEMLKAQAVAIRTYALYRAAQRRREPYDLGGDATSQVYGGVGAETPECAAAAAATQGQILVWEGKPILAVYHATAGGRTASSEEVWGRPLPYLRSREVRDEEESPDTYWRTALPRTKLGPALLPHGVRVGAVQGLRILERWPSGRVRSVEVRGRDGVARIEARTLRRALGAQVIRSTLFETRNAGETVVFSGSGHGHGVGMSQWAAQAMARSGADYRAILAVFYPGAELVEVPR